MKSEVCCEPRAAKAPFPINPRAKRCRFSKLGRLTAPLAPVPIGATPGLTGFRVFR